MKKATYSVTFFDKEGDWSDRDEDLDTLDAARKHAEAKTAEGGYSRIDYVEPQYELRWERKFKIINK